MLAQQKYLLPRGSPARSLGNICGRWPGTLATWNPLATFAYIGAMNYKHVHLSDGLLYNLLEPELHLGFRAFFRQLHVNNRHGVPANQPVLVACNHPTAFLDPLLLCLYLDPPIYNMTRGDIFRKPFFRRLMESCNMFPVFRSRDGYHERNRNDGMFEFCEKKLLHRQAVTIYVEGEHHLEKRVRPVQKGLARIAFSTYEKHQLTDLQIIPVGCNYQYGDRPREEAMLNVGWPIFVRDYWADYQRSPGAAITRLGKDLEAALKQICFHLEGADDDALAEQLLTLHRSSCALPMLPVVRFESPRFAGEKAVLDRLNALPEADKDDLRGHCTHYFTALQQAGLDDAALLHPNRANLGWTLLLALGALPALAGWLSSLPIRLITYQVADRRVTKKEFYGSVVLGLSYIVGLVYYLLWLLISLFTADPRWIALALLLPLLGWFSIFYRELGERWLTARRARQHPQRAALLALRQNIFATTGPGSA